MRIEHNISNMIGGPAVPTKKTYLFFNHDPALNVYRVTNKHAHDLGFIDYHNPWRQHVWVNPIEGEIYLSAGCLLEIKNFLDDLNSKKGVYKKLETPA